MLYTRYAADNNDVIKVMRQGFVPVLHDLYLWQLPIYSILLL